ncbi:MAG: hypothetical protein K0U93_19125 [Gammaproteobacteria bacterium]|nr:hypothetical protein [Gammaproteobacteria bacterium]
MLLPTVWPGVPNLRIPTLHYHGPIITHNTTTKNDHDTARTLQEMDH